MFIINNANARITTLCLERNMWLRIFNNNLNKGRSSIVIFGTLFIQTISYWTYVSLPTFVIRDHRGLSISQVRTVT